MRAVAFTILALFAILFVLTMVPYWPESRQAAERADFTAAQIDQGVELALQRNLISWVGTFLSLGFLVWLVFSGKARRIADYFNQKTGNRWWLTLLLMGGFCFLARRLLLFPLNIISLENWRAWGFLTERALSAWLLDYAKSLALSASIGAILLVGLYILMRTFPRWWWAVAAGCGVVFGIAYAWILPIWIDPLYYEFQPLNDAYSTPKRGRAVAQAIGTQGLAAAAGPLALATPLAVNMKLVESQARAPTLAQRIRQLANRAGVPVEQVLVMTASTRGYHTNAYFTGFGSTRRIVLYDTLLKKHPPEEIESIVAHEIGHWRHRHITLGIALAAVGSIFGFFLLSRILPWAVNRAPFHLRSAADPAGVPLLLLLTMLGTWLAMPLQNAVSRHFERQADATSLQLAGKPDVFINAERRLARNNKQNVAPTPWTIWLFFSHPPTVERIQMARRWQEQQR